MTDSRNFNIKLASAQMLLMVVQTINNGYSFEEGRAMFISVAKFMDKIDQLKSIGKEIDDEEALKFMGEVFQKELNDDTRTRLV